MIADGEDLYDDLFGDVGDSLLYKAPLQSLQENDAREEEFKKKEAELNGRVDSLLKEVEALQQDKAVLTRNISCLFKTAQLELARKDKQMKELREENLRLKPGGTQRHTNNRPPVTKPAAPAEKTTVDKDSSEQGNEVRQEGSTGVFARIRDPDSDGHRELPDEGRKGRSPGRGSGDQRRDRVSDRISGSSRRTGDDVSDRQKSFSDSGSDRRREYRHSEHRNRDRSRDRRDSGDGKSLDSRKRHRS